MFSFSQATQIGHQFFVAGLSALILSASASAQVILRVDGDNGGVPPNSDGSDWGNLAFKFLQDALAAAGDVDPELTVEIWVAAGTYHPDQDAANQNGSGQRTASFHLMNSVELYGGFAGDEVDRDDRRPFHNQTILTGNLAGSGSRAYNVVSAIGTGSNPIDDSAVIDGFVIRDGLANGPNPAQRRGAGLHAEHATPFIRGCWFRENDAVVQGGAIHFGGSLWTGQFAVQVRNCEFIDNGSDGAQGTDFGGAISVGASHLTLEFVRCKFIGNGARLDGGAVAVGQGNLVVANSLFEWNGSGGAWRSHFYRRLCWANNDH